jgi:antitoxin YefM
LDEQNQDMSDDKNMGIDNLDYDDPMDETSCLIKSDVNKRRLQEAIDEMNSGVRYSHQLIKD